MKFNNKKAQPFSRQGQYYMMRNQQPIGWGKPAPIVRRHRTSFPFVAISDDAEHRSFAISPNKLTCFHGFSSLFTLQHRGSFMIDGITYKSVDQYYQMRKVKDLLGAECEKFTDGSANNYSSLAKDLLKQSSVDRRTIDKWRVTCGVNAIQKALLEKVRQSEVLRDALAKTGDTVIVHTYAADDFFGTGVPYKYVKDWCTGMEEKKVIVKFPMMYPLTDETVKNIPSIGKGRNVLGVIYMILREKMANGQLDSLKVDLIPFENTPSEHFVIKSQNPKPAAVAAANISNHGMEIDFTADVDAIPTSSETTTIKTLAMDVSSDGDTAPTSSGQPSKVKIRVKRTNAAAPTRASARKVAQASGPPATGHVGPASTT